MLTLMVVGKLGQDADLGYTNGGTPVLNLSLASNRRYTNNAGEAIVETTWIRASIWGPLAEKLKPFCTKGKTVALNSESIRANAYLNKQNGQPAASLEAKVLTIELGGDGVRHENGAEPQEANEPADSNDIPF